ncbi:hypothetical protein [Vibrio parahaemolyticus]|uniref:hypothetical protein n=1 Tax=Vibrio parahaemolyticus TaxID=670 RepID=UPI0023613A9B|nr:hypothetical protein [Vibrio parahaemolyticus]
MKRKVFFVACASLALSACGGGEGGEKDSNTIAPSNNESQCGNMPEMSCSYDINKLTLNFSLRTTSDYMIRPGASFYASGYSQGIFPSQIDTIEIHADGKVYKPDNKYNPNVSFPIIPVGAPAYEFYWYRNGDLVTSTSIDQIASPINIVSKNEKNGRDIVSVEWIEENNHQYDVELRFLTCTQNNGEVVNIDPIEYRYENHTSPFSFSLQEQFSRTIDELKSDYAECDVFIDISSKNLLTTPSHQSRKLLIHSYSGELFNISLF